MSFENEIIKGDCVTTLKSIPSGSVDLVVTDPPYLVNYRDRSGRSIVNDDPSGKFLACFDDIYRVLAPDSFCVCFYGWGKVDAFFNAWTSAGFRPAGHIVWRKEYASRTGYLNYCHEQAYLLTKGRPRKPIKPLDDIQPWEYSGNRAHPTEKAVGILTPLIRSFSKPGGLVLDPFAGSGSTLVAAALAGRRYLGIEIEDRYCEIARHRLSGVSRYRLRCAA
jgi:site-specific DNA-methyltransferase (adenine-specific)